jgi:hypothetical protein
VQAAQHLSDVAVELAASALCIVAASALRIVIASV